MPFLYSILAACLVGLMGLMNQSVIARQLDDWQVLPKPQRLSELYFTPATPLPTSAQPGVGQNLSFTVHNIEHRTTLYHYRLFAVPSDGGAVRSLGDGAVTLDHDQSQDVTRMVSLPSLGGRVAIRVELEYKVMKPEGTFGTQKQSIHHWTHMTAESRP